VGEVSDRHKEGVVRNKVDDEVTRSFLEELRKRDGVNPEVLESVRQSIEGVKLPSAETLADSIAKATRRDTF